MKSGYDWQEEGRRNILENIREFFTDVLVLCLYLSGFLNKRLCC